MSRCRNQLARLFASRLAVVARDRHRHVRRGAGDPLLDRRVAARRVSPASRWRLFVSPCDGHRRFGRFASPRVRRHRWPAHRNPRAPSATSRMYTGRRCAPTPHSADFGAEASGAPTSTCARHSSRRETRRPAAARWRRAAPSPLRPASPHAPSGAPGRAAHGPVVALPPTTNVSATSGTVRISSSRCVASLPQHVRVHRRCAFGMERQRQNGHVIDRVRLDDGRQRTSGGLIHRATRVSPAPS
jgi:hypothetical protein